MMKSMWRAEGKSYRKNLDYCVTDQAIDGIDSTSGSSVKKCNKFIYC